MNDLTKFGYADGNYTNPCYTCHKEFIGDKRARTCLTCAQQMLIEKLGKAEGIGNLGFHNFILLCKKWLEQYPPDVFTDEGWDAGPVFIHALREAIEELEESE